MLRRYAKLSNSIWHSQKFRALKNNDRPKFLYFYFHTCPQSNSVGCFHIPLGYIVTDMMWGEEQVSEAIERLATVLLVEWNANEQIVRLVDFIKHDPPTNPNHAAAMENVVLALPDCNEKLKTIIDLLSHKQAHKCERLRVEVERLSQAFPEAALTHNLNLNHFPSSASAELLRAGDASQLQQLSRFFGFDETDFLRHERNLRTLIQLKTEDACDFDKHIWPAAQACKNGKRIQALSYIRPKAIELRDAEKTIASLPAVFKDTDERGWRDRQRTLREKGLWSPEWGGKPGESDCRVPKHLLEHAA